MAFPASLYLARIAFDCQTANGSGYHAIDDSCTMNGDLPPRFRRALETARNEGILNEFAELDVLRVAHFSDKELAAWQFQQQPGTPQYIIADHEWQRRLTIQQVRAAYRTAWIGVIGTLLGTLLGAIIGWWLATISPIK